MIKFFRHIRQRLIAESRFRKYVVYAIGEIILVVIGILIALQINTWNSAHIQRGDERKILIELKKGLALDQQSMALELAICEAAVEKMKRLQFLLEDKDYAYTIGLDSLFGQVYGIRKIFLNKAFYEDLKSSGLRIIDNDDIRLQIVQLFEDNYTELYDIFNFAEPSVNEVTRPYYLANFHDIDFKDLATPNNFDMVWNDSYYHNIVDYRIIGVTSNQVDSYKRTLPAIEKLINSINDYLKLESLDND